MADLVYVEDSVAGLPRTLEICERLKGATFVRCDRYGQVFNRHAQNFRLQKRRPALILARKEGRLVLEAPAGYGIGGERNFYFSHMLNCVYDCRYCFLQGMFQSAHHVVFVNFEDFQRAISETAAAEPSAPVYFFSGYDCDSLAFEPITGFAAEFVPWIQRLPNAWLEIRTKSLQIRSLLKREAAPRCVLAFSMTPAPIAAALEHGVPPLPKRIEAMAKLQERGWPLGLRFDPLIYCVDYKELYTELFREVFEAVDPARLHSVSFGPFRLPRGYFKRMARLFPDEPLFAGPLADAGGMVSYREELEQEMTEFCSAALREHVPQEVFFPCRV